jgi:mannose-6-phosphate isomerase-like protein (cupin superfamily)
MADTFSLCRVCHERPAAHIFRRLEANSPAVEACSETCAHIYHRMPALPTNPTPGQLHAALLHYDSFRTVLWTDTNEEHRRQGSAVQIVSMVIDDRASWEVHPANMQYFAVAVGTGYYKTNPAEPGNDQLAQATSFAVDRNSKWVVAPGTYHEVGGKLRLLVIYSPPHHPVDRVDLTQLAAEEREAREQTEK